MNKQSVDSTEIGQKHDKTLYERILMTMLNVRAYSFRTHKTNLFSGSENIFSKFSSKVDTGSVWVLHKSFQKLKKI